MLWIPFNNNNNKKTLLFQKIRKPGVEESKKFINGKMHLFS